MGRWRIEDGCVKWCLSPCEYNFYGVTRFDRYSDEKMNAEG